MRSSAVRGFTLLELMTALAVLGVLLGIGIPAFRETMAINRTSAAVNQFITAISLARSEARKRGIPISICAANADQDDCEDTPQWRNGWLVFTDDDGTPGVVDDDDAILQVYPAIPEGFTLTATAPATLSYMRFQRTGGPDVGSSARTLKLARSGCAGEKARQVVIANTGRVSTGKIAC